MPNSNERLSIRVLDAETIEIEATPRMLLDLIATCLAYAEGDATSHGYDTLLMSGVQLAEGSVSLLLYRVPDARARSRHNNPTSPEKLEPLQFEPGYDGLQLNASKDGLISLSRALIRILASEAGVS